MIQTLEWTSSGVRFIDQTKLPTEETYVTCTTHQQVADVIRNMVVRGAPAIGVAAGMGVALGIQNSEASNVSALESDFNSIAEIIAATRPTAVNLFWGIRRMRDKFDSLKCRPITWSAGCKPRWGGGAKMFLSVNQVLIPAGHGVTCPAQIFGQIIFHLDGGLERHWIQVSV